MPKPADGRGKPQKVPLLWLLSSAGIMFPVSITLGAVAGYYVDHWLNTFPWLSFVGFCFGVAAAFINLVRVLKKFDEDT